MNRSWIIGSAPACDIRPSSPYVSGRHCQLDFDGATWTLTDLASKNGTFVNGSALQGKAVVRRDDVITLGRSVPFPWPEIVESPPAGGSPAKSVALPPVGQAIVIGRGSGCDVRLDFPMISTRHASIEHLEGGWVVRDLGSTNGTFVRGHRITEPVYVHAGDVVGLGSYRLTLSADEQRLLEQDRRDGMAVEVSQLAVKAAGRWLIGDVSFVARQGEMVGIMGPSGAGKSTLLSALVGDQHPVEGGVVIGGVNLHDRYDELRGQVGYVPQDDIMHPDLTVWQSLWYSARLRLPRDFSDEEIRERLACVIAQLGLQGTEHTRIGNADRRGISGGQRKRVNVAMELITDPPVLILDEPTSGLSSVDALSLVSVLRSLAHAGKTVVLTLHQPGLDVLRMLDAVAILAKDDSTDHMGTLAWFGPPLPDALAFFQPPAQSGQASQDADGILRGLGRRTAAEWRDEYRRSSTYERWVAARLSGFGSATPDGTSRRVSTLDSVFQAWVLARRMLAVKFADSWNTAILLAQAPLIALLIAGVFAPKARKPVDVSTWETVSTAVGMTTFLLALAAVWCGVSNAARELVAERAVYRRERAVGLSRVAYLASKVAVLSLLCLVQCAILWFAAASGCRLAASPVFALPVLFLAATAGVAIGLALSAAARSPEAAAAVLPLVILPMVVLGGSLLPLWELPGPAVYVADLMPSRWGFEALLCGEAAARTPPDMASPWFPEGEWRTRWFVPPLMLAALTALGVYAANAVLALHEAGRRRPPTG